MLAAQKKTGNNCSMDSTEEILLLLAEALDTPVGARLVNKIRALLCNFEGIESSVDTTSEIPKSLLADILQRSNQWPKETRLLFVSHQVSRLSLFFYHTAGDSEKWNPLQGSLENFRCRNRRVETWQDEAPYPPPEAVLAWLKQ